MRRRIRAFLLLAALTVMGAAPAGAQLALKGGVSFASTTESDFLPDLDTRTGFAAGLSLGLPLGGALQLRPEVLYVQKGGEFAEDGSLELSELDVPALLQLDLPVPALSPFLYAGPQAEFELSCKAFDEDCVDTRSVRWGAVLGGGVRFGSLSGEIRYNWTISELSEDVSSQPRTLLLLLGLHFGRK